MQDKTLLTISVVTDDDTGIYTIGELDFGKTGHCEPYLSSPGNRQKFVSWLHWLANQAEYGEPPFWPIEGQPRSIIPELSSADVSNE